MPAKPSKNIPLKIIANKRQHKRVRVALHGAICPSNKKAELIRTVNISEGGVCIRYQGQTPLKLGNEVKLQLEGILSSGPQRDLDIYKTSVVYMSRDRIGLKFLRA